MTLNKVSHDYTQTNGMHVVMQQLSESLIAVIWQDLLKRKDEEGR
jgi:Tfp pilus assembly pilus retraction ATPase PilT